MHYFLYVFAFFATCLLAGCSPTSFVEGEPEYREGMNGWERKAALETPSRMQQIACIRNSVDNWPPQESQTFPNIELVDHEGKAFSMQSLAGKPVLIEFVAMSCAGCQAFAGGNKYGGFKKFATQDGLKSMEEYFQQYTGHPMDNPNLNVVQLIVYDLKLSNPSPNELAMWRQHFHLTSPNLHVVGGTKALANGASMRMIPGFMLLDADLKIISDSTGHRPKRNFYRDLLPQVKEILDRPSRQLTPVRVHSDRTKHSNHPKSSGKEVPNPFLTK